MYQRFLGEDGLSGHRGVALHRAAGVDRGRDARGLAAGNDAGSEPLYGDGTRSPAPAVAEFLAVVPEHLHQVGFTGTGGNTDDAISAAGSWAWIFA